MFDSIGWGEILVLMVAGLFILGPERLPGAAAWLGRTVRQVKDYASGASQHLRSELGPEFDELRKPLNELRGLRGMSPRGAINRSLFADEPEIRANGNSTDPASGGRTPHPAAGSKSQLIPAERPPVDYDGT